MASNSFEKLIQEIGNMSVIELNDFVKALEEKFGVSAAAMSAAAPAAAAAARQLHKLKKKLNTKLN